jgi:tRNA uridine 5-carbamoylmethylation protein Kti12
MANSIRTPRQGVTASSRRIAEAVDDENWQKVRLSMKGISTAEKLDVLEKYYDENIDAHKYADVSIAAEEREREDIKIRIDNYIKALCRGGQLEAGMTFDHFSDGCIRNHIKK